MELNNIPADVTARGIDWWRQRRFLTMIGLVIVVSAVLVGIAMSLYNSSGAAQLDLSRPGYRAVRKEVVQDKNSETYSSTGALDKEAIDQFNAMYDTRTKNVSTTNSFNPNAMSDDTLQLFQAQNTTATPTQ